MCGQGTNAEAAPSSSPWWGPRHDLVPLLMRCKPRRAVLRRQRHCRGGVGRAWWHLGSEQRVPHPSPISLLAPGLSARPAVVAARVRRAGRDRAIVAAMPRGAVAVGFSQGDALDDVVLPNRRGASVVRCPSSAMDSVRHDGAAPDQPRFLLSHGRQDPCCPFPSGDRARELGNTGFRDGRRSTAATRSLPQCWPT